MARTAASIEKLLEVTESDPSLAHKIRAVWRGNNAEVRNVYPDVDRIFAEYHNAPGARELRRAVIDRLLKTCGVEYLGYHKRAGQHVHYCNAGDAYYATILFIGDRLVVGCWGDLVERSLISEPQHSF